MTALVLMYVYFDAIGDIKAISPDTMPDLASIYKVMTSSLSEVEPFLLSKKNTFDYYIKEVALTDNVTCKITRKEVLEINRLRFINNALTEVSAYVSNKDAGILIENCIEEQVIRITLSSNITAEQQHAVEMEHTAQLFFTKKHDPYFLLHTVAFPLNDLFRKNSIICSYTGDLDNTSVFTKKLTNVYSYLIKGLS